ncbi:zinc ribbon domain-containing protein [Trichothermofontia sp.]
MSAVERRGHPVASVSTRTYRCPQCGFEMDRDQNAALNLLKRGLQRLGMEGQTVPKGMGEPARKGERSGRPALLPWQGDPKRSVRSLNR